MFNRLKAPKTVREISTEENESVRRGDQYRDQGAWEKAAESYQKHLDVHPSHFAIWVQLGNCLKEAGRFSEAGTAYARAIALNSQDPDVFLQQGHLFKLAGRSVDAIASYRRSLELLPESQDALIELLNLNANQEVSDVLGEDAIRKITIAQSTTWLDITDLIAYARENGSLSGIQRVVANLVSHAQGSAETNNAIIPVIPEYDNLRVFSVNIRLVKALITMLEEGATDRQLVNSKIDAIFASRREVMPVRGDFFVIAGAFWIYVHYDMIAQLRRRGVLFGLFIHDLIQIRNPQYVHHDATVVFQKRLVDILQLVNLVLTNSEYVAREVREYLTERMNFSVPVQAIPLATELRSTHLVHSIVSHDIQEIASQDFVLYVCTIEVRKNHIYLLRIWERLRQEMKGSRVPDLVFVGKWGWDIAPLREYLDKAGIEGNWLHIFNGISDAALAYLYERCLFTTYVSFAEGFGLPIGESFAHGKPCIASNVTSMPEVGGKLARYIDPFNIVTGYEMFRQTIQDRADLAQWTKKIEEEFKPKSWQQFCDEFFLALEEFSTGEDSDTEINCIIPEGQIVTLGDRALQELVDDGERLITLRMGRVSGWHSVEDWGVWASKRRAKLRFLTELAEHEPIKIYLRLNAPHGTRSARVLIRCGEIETQARIAESREFILADGGIARNGVLEIEILSQGPFSRPDNRELYVGLTALAYCRSADPIGRVSLLEKITLYSEPIQL